MLDTMERRINQRIELQRAEREQYKREQENLFVRVRTWGTAAQVKALRPYHEDAFVDIKEYANGLVWVHHNRLERTLIIDELGKRHVLPQKDYVKVSNVGGRARIIAV